MSTTAYAPAILRPTTDLASYVNQKEPQLKEQIVSPTIHSPRRNEDFRKIVRQEIQRDKELTELEAKYKNNEISKMEYFAKIVLINLKYSGNNIPGGVIYNTSTPPIEYMA